MSDIQQLISSLKERIKINQELYNQYTERLKELMQQNQLLSAECSIIVRDRMRIANDTLKTIQTITEIERSESK